MKRNFFLSAFLIFIIAFTFSCKKTEPDTETQSAIDNTICDAEFTRLAHSTSSFGINEQGVKRLSSNDPVFIGPDTVTNPGWPRIFTIDYGLGVVDSLDHKTRKGKVICKFSNYWHITGSTMTITLLDYSVNNMSVTVDSIYMLHKAQNTYTDVVYNAVCKTPDWSLSWACNRTLTQTEGSTTPSEYYDDAFSLTGNANGVNRNGKKYTTTISAPIVKYTSCSWIESGRIDLTPDGLATRTIDFGNGTCDNQASLIINGNTYTFTMN